MVLQMWNEMHAILLTFASTSRKGTLNIAKVQYKLRIASSLTYLGMEVWNGICKKILVWNGRKLPVWNMEKSSSIAFHTMPCL